MWVALENAKATHIFSAKNISVYGIFNDQSFNDTLTNDIVSLNNCAPYNYPIPERNLLKKINGSNSFL